MRNDGRKNDQVRIITLKKNVMDYAEGSAYIECGNTKVLCTASVVLESMPFRDSKGWVTAEYNMLPRATHSRNKRDISSLKKNSRGSEIERLIGRSLRACTDLDAFNDATIIVDCDVIQADGGTRTACINASFVALYEAFQWMIKKQMIKDNPIKTYLAAISVGLVDDEVMVDLAYEEDFRAQVDMNVVMNSEGEIAEVQGTGEGYMFNREQMNMMMDYSQLAIMDIIEIQKRCINSL